MNNLEITIRELIRLQDKYNEAAFKAKSKELDRYYTNLVNGIDDILIELRKEEEQLHHIK